MAKVNLTHPFAEIHGSIGKDKIINRQKKYRDERGRVIHEGIQEAYAVKHPRDYKKNPPQGEELDGNDGQYQWRPYGLDLVTPSRAKIIKE